MGVIQGRLQHDPFELGHGIRQDIGLPSASFGGHPVLQLLLPATGRGLAGPVTGGASDGVSSSGGQIATSTSWLEAITVSQRQTFSSWRTLPGQGRRLM